MNMSEKQAVKVSNPCFDFEESYKRYLAAILSNERQQCSLIFQQWLESDVGLRSLYEDLVRRSLYEVGDLWERGRISVATEHLATAISESLLNLAYPRLFAQPRLGKSAIVACVANEYHQIGGKMVADLFELNGWRGYFLGANTPMQSLKELIAEKNPDVLALSVSLALSMDTLVGAAAEVRASFPNLQIIVGGQAFRWVERERVEHLPGVHCCTSLAELEEWIKDGKKHV
jgi:methanogenic corrinoid protein MtbC1